MTKQQYIKYRVETYRQALTRKLRDRHGDYHARAERDAAIVAEHVDQPEAAGEDSATYMWRVRENMCCICGQWFDAPGNVASCHMCRAIILGTDFQWDVALALRGEEQWLA